MMGVYDNVALQERLLRKRVTGNAGFFPCKNLLHTNRKLFATFSEKYNDEKYEDRVPPCSVLSSRS
jgi:hypothetical protein